MQQTSSDKHWSNSMTDSSPITPPPELVQQWRRSGPADAAANNAYEHHIATRAAQWGADQELEACCGWLENVDCDDPQETAKLLRAARRPKPPSLKEQAMQALCRFMASEGHEDCTEEEVADDFTTIRRALEALPE
jgi:hypothetical protein